MKTNDMSREIALMILVAWTIAAFSCRKPDEQVLKNERISMNTTTFNAFPKIARLNRTCVITEKLDGTNASIHIGEDGSFLVGSRNRWITPEVDNFNFARWANEHKEQLLQLGHGTHFGEWWGAGIQRRYGLQEKRFSLFNTGRWLENPPPVCCHVVPVLWTGMFTTQTCKEVLENLRVNGSYAAPGFMQPEGIVVYHTAAKTLFKVTLEGDETPKSLNK